MHSFHKPVGCILMLSKNLVKFLVSIWLTYILNLIITSKFFCLTRTSFRCHKIREGLVEKVTEKFLKLIFFEIETIYESEWVNQFDATGFFLYPLMFPGGIEIKPGMKWVNRRKLFSSNIAYGFNPFHATGPFLYHPENIGKWEDCHCCTCQPSYKYEQCKLNFTCLACNLFASDFWQRRIQTVTIISCLPTNLNWTLVLWNRKVLQ